MLDVKSLEKGLRLYQINQQLIIWTIVAAGILIVVGVLLLVINRRNHERYTKQSIRGMVALGLIPLLMGITSLVLMAKITMYATYAESLVNTKTRIVRHCYYTGKISNPDTLTIDGETYLRTDTECFDTKPHDPILGDEPYFEVKYPVVETSITNQHDRKLVREMLGKDYGGWKNYQHKNTRITYCY